jgi:tRNA threonylcarbamoyladenosine biosynthesis protein TsaB
MARLERPVILALDTAGLACSVAVGVGEKLAGVERVANVHGQAEILLPLVDRVMAAAGLTPAALDVVAATVGPGSFTGIRVGLSAARGIALATGAQLFGVSSFDAVAAAVPRRDRERSHFLLVALESRREDLYVRIFDPLCNPIDEPAAIMPQALASAVDAMIGRQRLLIAGDAVHRVAAVLADRTETVLLEGAVPDAAGVLEAALSLIRRDAGGGAARPLYLRPPDVTLPSGRRKPGLALS